MADPTTVRNLISDAQLSAEPRVTGDDSAVVSGICVDSGTVVPGDVFCCIRGTTADGHSFAAAAVAAGATALVVERELDLPVTQIVVADTRRAVGPLAAAVHGHPSRSMIVVGITGTNGKTTTAYLLRTILEHAGLPTAAFGTLTGSFTTPEAPELQSRLAISLAEGKRAVVMEVSSHALALHRADGTRFAQAVFTNLGREHLDFHGTQEQYFAAKARLFTPALSDHGVVNLDDVYGRLLADVAEIPTIGFSLDELSELRAGAADHRYRWRGVEVTVPLGGSFNAANSLAAATVAHELGIDPPTIAAGLTGLPPIRGRFELVEAGQPFSVVIDFAHKTEALREVLVAARGAAQQHRVILVFGCGGDRDQAKRPAMGAIAAELADLVVVTSDNPRTEEPESIIASIIDGVPDEYRRRVTSIADRRSAIALALEEAVAGDVVVVAGKGHETTQTIGTTVVPFDDRSVVRELLETAS